VKVHKLTIIDPIYSAVIVQRRGIPPTKKERERRPVTWSPPPPRIPIASRYRRIPTGACPPPVIKEVVMVPLGTVPDFDPPSVAKIRYAVPVGIPRVAMHCLRDIPAIPLSRDVAQLGIARCLEPLQLSPIFVRPSVPGRPAVSNCLMPLRRP